MPQRRAARLLVVDDWRRVLLIEAIDPGDVARGGWWHTPGGGVEPGEPTRDAARREAFEELGLRVDDVDIDGPVHAQRIEFRFEGEHYVQHEEFFVLRVDADAVFDHSGWSEVELRSMREVRWWTLDELRSTSETIYPTQLADLLDRFAAAAGGGGGGGGERSN